jgi:tRNA nucleotidyltransferase (CCA-adding enzyme)
MVMSHDTDAFEAVVNAIHDRVTPTEKERSRLESVAAELTARAEGAIEDLPVEADVVRVGSTARETWLAGDRDIDLFIRFPPALSRGLLREYGLQIGNATLPDGHEEYAEHPYVKGTYDTFDVDCVPCYAVESAAEIQSAVDRTPFHNEYLITRLDATLAGEIRVAKAFLKAIGAYGSDLRTEGFSGYLVELLVLEQDGFQELTQAAADWQPPVRLDPATHGTREYDDELVVVDPTDPERNVAAACSATNIARFQHYARELIETPRESLFEPYTPIPLDAADVRQAIASRGTEPVAVWFETPDVVDDQLYPQLDKSRAGLAAELGRLGFDPLRTARFATDEHAVILVECGVTERPRIERHQGPPLGVRAHAEGFYSKYADTPNVWGPFIEEGRYIVEREREFCTPVDFCESDALFEVALGSHITSTLKTGYDVLAGPELGALADHFGLELARYFEPVP